MITLLWIVAWASFILSVAGGIYAISDLPGAIEVRALTAIGILFGGISSLCVFGAWARNLELLTGIHRALTGGSRFQPDWEREIKEAYEADNKRGIPKP